LSIIEPHEFIRQLWQDWNRNGKHKKSGIGILLSDSLDEIKELEFKNGIPSFMSQYYNNKWKQGWYKIK